MTIATPTKLRSGEWGARVSTSEIERGDTITITTKSGKSWDATVTKVIWTGNGAAIVATGSLDRPSRPATRRSTCPTDGDCWSFVDVKHCWECGK